jgi:MinD-like ATPase involved in chromosome partitioning or flagellar assembly
LCLLLYEAFRHAGKAVRIHDWNGEQGTSTKALKSIYGKIADVTGECEINIYDTPPSLLETATATAVLNANIALCLTTTEPADIWEAENAVQFVQNRNPNAIVRVVFNKVRKGTVLGRLVDECAKGLSAPAFPVILNTRECYKHSIAHGWSALDSAAREEVLQFAVAMLSLR